MDHNHTVTEPYQRVRVLPELSNGLKQTGFRLIFGNFILLGTVIFCFSKTAVLVYHTHAQHRLHSHDCITNARWLMMYHVAQNNTLFFFCITTCINKNHRIDQKEQLKNVQKCRESIVLYKPDLLCFHEHYKGKIFLHLP